MTAADALTVHDRVALSADARVRDLGGRCVLVLGRRLETIALNAVAARCLELATGRSVGEIVAVIASEFDPGLHDIEADVIAFLVELRSLGAITVC